MNETKLDHVCETEGFESRIRIVNNKVVCVWQ